MITISLGNKTIEYNKRSHSPKNLLSILRENGCYINAPCNGLGQCGKCTVTVTSGTIAASDSDKKFFSNAELDAGKRLACTCYPESDLTISLDFANAEKDFEIISDFTTDFSNQQEAAKSVPCSHDFAIAIDIGTTTIAAILLDLSTGLQTAVATRINHQRTYGSNVISRIQAANEGHLEKLHELIVADILACISELLANAAILKDAAPHICKIVIGANTTMTHLLMDYSCQTLGIYPFTPVNIGLIKISAKEILGSDAPDCSLEIMPGISTFVGGDIVSGIFATDLSTSSKPSILIDLGTNGEIALGNKERILVTSTAAGPAFEGGNISCGTGSVKGAVSDFTIQNGKPVLQLIGGCDCSPTGICGTGVVSITAALLENGFLDDTGAFAPEDEDGYPFAVTASGKELVFTQGDVREIQLAKAAICAGVEILIKRYGIGPDDVEHVYIAGGFGLKLDIKKALSIGLFPDALAGKISMVGNSCLSGLTKYLMTDNPEQSLSSIVAKSRELSLATDQEFNDLYINNMYFS